MAEQFNAIMGMAALQLALESGQVFICERMPASLNANIANTVAIVYSAACNAAAGVAHRGQRAHPQAAMQIDGTHALTLWPVLALSVLAVLAVLADPVCMPYRTIAGGATQVGLATVAPDGTRRLRTFTCTCGQPHCDFTAVMNRVDQALAPPAVHH